MNQFKLLVVIIFAFIVAVFAVSNQQTASLNFFGKTILPDVSLVIVVLGSVLAGVLITAILGFLLQTKLKKEISKQKKEISQLQGKEEKLQLKIRDLEEQLEEAGIPYSESDVIKEPEE